MNTRPALGDVKVGDELLVLPTSYGRSHLDPIPVRVTTAARVWLTMKPIDESRRREYRMRRDTQDTNNGYSHGGRFVTAEQYAWEQARNAAFKSLRGQGIELRTDSPWHGREIELADIIRAATEG
jgi:hypothetical protein